MRYRIGSRVHYRVYPSGLPATDIVGTVTDIGRHATKAKRLTYSVMWDDVDAERFAPTPGYMASDLSPIAGNAQGRPVMAPSFVVGRYASGYRPACACGWHGMARGSRARAVAAGEAHIERIHAGAR